MRDAMARNAEATLAAVRAIGYRDVELLWSFNNFGRTPQQVRTTLDKEGLRAPTAHSAAETILNDWDRSLEAATRRGHGYLIVPELPAEAATSLDGWRQWADRFNRAGATARRAGVWLAFHNEPVHLEPVDGIVPYELFVERTDPAVVRHQLDVGNMALGGADPMRYLEKYRSRYWSFTSRTCSPIAPGTSSWGRGAWTSGAFCRRCRTSEASQCTWSRKDGPTRSRARARTIST